MKNPNLITLEETTDLVHEYGLVHLAMIMDRLGEEIVVQAADLRELTEDDLKRFGDKTPSFARTLKPPSDMYLISHVCELTDTTICTLYHDSERDDRLFVFPFSRNYAEEWIPLPWFGLVRDDLLAMPFVPPMLRAAIGERQGVDFGDEPDDDFIAALFSCTLAYCVAVHDWDEKKTEFN